MRELTWLYKYSHHVIIPMHCLTSLKILAELWCHLDTFGANCVGLLFLECPTLFFLIWVIARSGSSNQIHVHGKVDLKLDPPPLRFTKVTKYILCVSCFMSVAIWFSVDACHLKPLLINFLTHTISFLHPYLPEMDWKKSSIANWQGEIWGGYTLLLVNKECSSKAGSGTAVLESKPRDTDV